MNALDKAPHQRKDLSTLLEDIDRLEGIFAGWDESPRLAAQAYRTAIEALHGEALRRLVGALKGDAAAASAMRQAAADETVYAVLRRHDIIKPSVAERVENALAGVRPMLASHGGDVELVKVAPPAIQVRFTGACDGCAASALTFHAGVKKAVEDACPDITEIVQVKGHAGGATQSANFTSPFALNLSGDWFPASRLEEIPEGGICALPLNGQKLLLFRRGSVVSCFQNACAHLGFPIHDGEVEDGIIACPHHGFRYDLTTGECLTAPEVQLQPHAVRVIGSRVEVRLAK
jgi:nitrite reductase/ring-hydroxylating ferredoxin subunit/Fe-S cluster biogenesis protein NfuA